MQAMLECAYTFEDSTDRVDNPGKPLLIQHKDLGLEKYEKLLYRSEYTNDG